MFILFSPSPEVQLYSRVATKQGWCLIMEQSNLLLHVVLILQLHDSLQLVLDKLFIQLSSATYIPNSSLTNKRMKQQFLEQFFCRIWIISISRMLLLLHMYRVSLIYVKPSFYMELYASAFCPSNRLQKMWSMFIPKVYSNLVMHIVQGFQVLNQNSKLSMQQHSTK